MNAYRFVSGWEVVMLDQPAYAVKSPLNGT